MSCGCPAVSTRCGGPEEFVIDDTTGYLVDFTPAAAADAIQRLLGDRQRRDQLGAAARNLVLGQYNESRCRDLFGNAFHHVFGKPTG
jgi:glycosyltransferase involved in cell wall biosynthesis